MLNLGIHLAEWGLVPDRVVRAGIRRLLGERLAALDAEAGPDASRFEAAFVERLKRHALAEHTADANAQHYEVPTALFETMLGPRLKYSSAYYAQPDTTLAEAEEAMLQMTAAHAELCDGQNILELGCGWGSLTLWMAEHYPRARITAVTNSATQAAHVQGQAQTRGLSGVRVLRANVRDFLSDQTYDRIVSVEMFEHVRNYAVLFNRLQQWLVPGGKLFVHVFSHRRFPYLFETEGADDWMGRYFFTGGTMPSHGLLPRFAGALTLEEAWRLDGRHYARTLEDWLVNLDRNRRRVRRLFADTYGSWHARVWRQRWRIFLMASAELFAYDGGAEWGVSHYRFAARAGRPAESKPARRQDAGGGSTRSER
ncbi:MAG: cyclopropane-fatty-acyl-phospholipid synthase family protein [Lentisphaerae bacterium]|nr:cyclopropane-fatty-acyl-phospholipid synthase family protein [Lentisphaerota bacterium]